MSRPATTRLKVNPAQGVMPSLQFCLVEQLQIDPAYQRSMDNEQSLSLVRRIATYWNWDLCQPLVVARRADGGLWVVDGQHRLAAARLRDDIPQLPCVVSNYASAADEAASFVALNRERRPLSALDLFRAAISAGDETALAVSAAMTEFGLSVAPHTNCTAWKPGMVSNVKAIERAWRVAGPARTRRALSTMASAFSGQVLQYCGTVFAAAMGGVEHCRDDDRVIAILRRIGQSGFREKVALYRARSPNTRFAEAAAAIMRAQLGAQPGDPAVALQPAPRPPARTAPSPTKPAPVASSGLRAPVVAAPDRSEAEMLWCDQCDRRVRKEAATFCTKKFCSIRKGVVA